MSIPQHVQPTRQTMRPRAWAVLWAAALAAAVTTPARAEWATAWAAAAQDYAQSALPLPGAVPPPALSLGGSTLRQRVHPDLAGTRVRVRFSNVFGQRPLRIGAASIARSTGGDAVSPASLHALRFHAGQAQVEIAPGAEAWSDPVSIATEPGQALAVSFHLDRDTPAATVHHQPLQASWIAPGNAVNAPKLPAAVPTDWNHIVTGLDVDAPPSTRVVVAFGDSITEGSGASDDLSPRPYPERLAERLRQPAGQGGAAISVLNTGIGGNRLLKARAGPRGLDRFDRDVLAQSGVTHVVVLIGVNDIGLGALPDGPATSPAPQRPAAGPLTTGLQELVTRARARGVKVLLGTLLPFKGSGYWSEDNEATRQAVNRWIRGRQGVDAVVDFDAAMRSADDPLMLNPTYDSGDHLHPNDAGNAAMAALIDARELLE